LEAVLLYLSEYVTKDEKQKYRNRKSHPYTGLDRPIGLQEVGAPRISRQSAHEGGKVVSFRDQPPLCPGDFPGIISFKG
jgi:hypothetical protein